MASIDIYRPWMIVDKVTDIDPASLDCSAILIDFDNTLLPWKDVSIDEATRKWVGDVKKSGIKICIVSNTHYPKRLRAISNDLNVFSIAAAMKPSPAGYKKAARLLGCDIRDCVVIGDQLMTDIRGGNSAGCRTILVTPIEHKEFIGTKISRVFERRIMKKLGIAFAGTPKR